MKIFETFSNIIINAAIAHGFLFAFFLPRHKNQNARFLLSILLVNLSIIIFRIHYLMQFEYERLGSAFFLSGPFMFLLGPFLFFYLRGVVLPGTMITRKDLPHFAVFAVFLVLIMPVYIYGRDSDYATTLQRFIGTPWIFLILQIGYYLIQTNRLQRMHRENMVEKFSNVEGMDASWLKLIFWIFILIFLFITIAAPSLLHGINFAAYKTISALFFSLILFFIAFKGLQQRVPVDPGATPEKDQNTTDAESLGRLKEQLLSHMKGSKPYLDPELTLTDLAKQVAISRNQLSLVINTGVGDNFYNFINTYRIEEVKELIKNDTGKQYTILSLASDAGFNSKSSFNSIFKKMTGLTPSTYRDGDN